jgi:hypothetical protein
VVSAVGQETNIRRRVIYFDHRHPTISGLSMPCSYA